jgi:hypothetical protein
MCPCSLYHQAQATCHCSGIQAPNARVLCAELSILSLCSCASYRQLCSHIYMERYPEFLVQRSRTLPLGGNRHCMVCIAQSLYQQIFAMGYLACSFMYPTHSHFTCPRKFLFEASDSSVCLPNYCLDHIQYYLCCATWWPSTTPTSPFTLRIISFHCTVTRRRTFLCWCNAPSDSHSKSQPWPPASNI